jgi:hypothetical protein
MGKDLPKKHSCFAWQRPKKPGKPRVCPRRIECEVDKFGFREVNDRLRECVKIKDPGESKFDAGKTVQSEPVRKIVEQLIAHFRIVNASGNHHGGDRWQTIRRILHQQIQAHGLKPGNQCELICAVPFPTYFQAFFQHQSHGFAQGENQRDRRGVMIEAVLAPIIHRRRQIEIPALHFRLALAKNFFGGGTDGNRRHSRRGADGLLRSAETNVDAFAIHVQRHGCEGRHRVDNQECAQFVSQLSIRFDSRDDAGRSLPVRKTNNFDVLAFCGAAHVFHIDRLAVWGFDLNYFRRRTRPNLVHAFGEHAVHGYDALVALFQRVQHRRFDPT